MNDLVTRIKTRCYDPHGLTMANYTDEAESQTYGACTFEIHDKKCVSRNAKITPTKTGQFVTLWKRTHTGITAPFDSSDTIDLVIIHIQDGDRLGLFIFPQALLIEKKIISTAKKEGKRGFRIYPPWDRPTSRQALKTQDWQQFHFIDLTKAGSINSSKIKSFL
ncbi:MepB family protein [Reichenbachiella carrageenanivorans]|uniref:MepB family protein n=1 Tax=Reichenbachiella carrageenanivorans TaxID=2979869 RepID=A0ABY6D330_9BACT|nr:MepB family protein [Reichenbachiella carrageenanivorans]UXX80304.1 MepB family protein [Reichenbachiella carrageenanivorans]